MSYFVKLLGSTDWPMPIDPWDRDPEMHTEVRFPKPQPTDVHKGDELVYYAVGGFKCIFGASRVEEPPVLNPTHSNPEVARRWPYAAPVWIRDDAKLKYLTFGPQLNEVTPGLQSNIRQGVSHFEIGRAEFDRAISLLHKAKFQEETKIKGGWRP